MVLRINRKKYSGETKIECFAAFMHQQIRARKKFSNIVQMNFY